LAAEILDEHAMALPGGVTIEPSSGGVFEVFFNDELIYSKKRLGRFPESGEVEQLLLDKLA
jgi:selenoprotein W-related protein